MAVTLQNVKVIILPLAKTFFFCCQGNPLYKDILPHELKHFLQYMMQNKNIICTQNIHMQFLKGFSEMIIRQKYDILFT